MRKNWLPRCLFLFTALITLAVSGFTQQSEDELTTSEIDLFNQEALEMYYSLEGRILLILTPEIGARDLKIAISNAKKLFSNTGKIQDRLFFDDEPETYDSYQYFEILRNQFRTYYDIDKRWALKSKPNFRKAVTGVFTDTSGAMIQYPVYKTHIRFTESCILTNKAGSLADELVKAKDKHYNLNYAMDKEIEVELRKFPDRQWNILFSKINVLPDSLSGNGEVSELTSDVKKYLDNLKATPLPSIVMVDPPAEQSASKRIRLSIIEGTPQDRPPQSYQPIGIQHLLVPGLGHHKIGRKKDSVHSYLYFIPSVLAFSTAGFFKLRSDNFYQKHLHASTLEALDKNYPKANENHQRFLIALGAGALIWIASDVHLVIKNKKQKKLEQQRSLSISPYFETSFYSNHVGISTRVEF